MAEGIYIDPVQLVLAAFVGHFVLVMVLYTALTVLRMRDVRAGTTAITDYVREDGDGPVADRIRRNIANQFELPMFAWLAVAMLVALGAIGQLDAIAAWLLLAGRAVHTFVQTSTENVKLRGMVYLVTAIATSLLVGHAAWVGLGLGSP